MAPSDSGANPPLKLARDSTENAARLPGPRNLIVCIDGTSNKYGDKNTNVVELHSHIKKSDMQLTYYTSGVGTYAKPSWRSPSYYFGKKVDHGVDLLIAWNFEKVVIAAYRWLSNSYLPGDRIFLFGFSRGAYQIRALAGMIATVGLMFPGNQEQIPFAYELYSKYLGGPIDMASAIMARNRSARVHDPVELSERKVNNFRMTFSRPEVGVHFLGAWDTVSSVGIRRGKLLPLTNRCEHIKYFRHALAMDERRVKFMPEHIERSRNGEVDDNHIKEVWFTGTHSDIGGGNIRNIDLNRGAEPLVWMMNEAEKAGLVVDPTNLGQDVKTARIVPSLTLGWWIFELLPLTRLSSDGLSTTNRPHLGRGRRIPEHHKIHYSVLANRLQLKDPVYKPRATFKRWNWKDAGSQKAALWEGDDKLVKALEIVRTVDDELLKAANPDPHSHDWLNDVKELLYRSDTSAKMIWEHGGLPFLLKIAKFENLKLVREIVEAVLGTHRRRSASPSSLGATLVDRKKESLSAPPSNAKSEDPLVQEGIPRLPDLLLCYTETGPSIPETSAAATKTKKTGNCIWLPKFTHWRHSIEGFLGKTSRINQPSQDMSSDPLNTEVTLKPAGPILVEIALNIVKDLSQEGYSQDIVKTDVVQCLIHLLTLEPSTIGTRDQWLDLILSALEAMAILAHQHGTANSKLPTKRIASVVLALKGEELVALSLRVLRALAADRGSHEYLLQSTFLKFLKHSLSRDDHVSVAEAFHIIAALVKDEPARQYLLKGRITASFLAAFNRYRVSGNSSTAVRKPPAEVMSRAEHDGLDIAKALVADEGVRTEVISKDTMCTIASLLDDRVEYVTRKAIDVVVSFATYADGRTQIFQSEVIKNIINHMKDDALVCNVLDAITELDRLTGLKWPDEMAKDVSKVVVDTLLQKQNENDSQSTKIFYKIVEMIETLVDNDKLLNQMLEEKLFDALLTFPRIGSNEQDAQKRQGGQQKGQKGQGGQEEQGARNGQDKQEGQRNATMSEGPKRKRRGKQKGQQEPKGEGRQDMPKGQMRQQQRGRGRPRSRIHPDYVGRLGKVLSCIQNITKNDTYRSNLVRSDMTKALANVISSEGEDSPYSRTAELIIDEIIGQENRPNAPLLKLKEEDL